ncbi:hypothetical protein T11_349 [Trichinella zimbabwensis]|uniref:Uncharacterized protein n=1 Tax=Trichinella zimbabwensis TaxID=268475 RepID=A0A0V1G7U6_9BILA|nr:hypothetical protein T11_349 [Trichinella zimbabwensis]
MQQNVLFNINYQLSDELFGGILVGLLHLITGRMTEWIWTEHRMDRINQPILFNCEGTLNYCLF